MADSTPSLAQRGFTALALAFLMACVWSMTHIYRDFSADATLYAVQAMAKLHRWLADDIYLKNASQDSYTVFSWFYAKVIAAIGVHQAARTLYVVFSVWFFAATWTLMRRVADPGIAWFAVLLQILLVGHYGSFGVFHYAEDYLTARALAEALVITSLACFYSGRRALALAVAITALFVHPLMALPGLLLLVCVWVGPTLSIAGAIGGICLTALIAVYGRNAAHPEGPFALIDGIWLTVVRERSQFLFLQLWRAVDWESNALPFASLVLTLVFVPDQRLRWLAWASMIVGATGLAVAFIAGSVGPVAILLQGQAWRWVWITSYASILLLAPTLIYAWREPRSGPLCALLLIGGWFCDFLNIWFCMGIALLLWILREQIPARSVRLLRFTAMLLAAILIAWSIALAWSTTHAPPAEVTPEASAAAEVRHVLKLYLLDLMGFGLFYWWIRTRRGAVYPAIACAALGTLAVIAWTGALQQARTVGTGGEISAFSSWRNAIPVGSNVEMLGVANSSSFVWFTLDRADYLSIDQSSGVVFSRATAEEVQRRSTVLEPLVRPSWKILSFLARRSRGDRTEDKDLPLTATALIRMCSDPQLNFLIAEQNVGFDPLRHTGTGAYKDWYLYDCRRVHAGDQPT